MILKDADDLSGEIAKLENLRDTSPRSFQSAIQKQINKLLAGRAGERSAAHFLNRHFGHSENIVVLHDLRLGIEGDFAQIDHLVIHRIQRSAWVLETKNYSGRLSCDEHGDWTVWRSGKPNPIPSPIAQAARHCELLRLWLEANGHKPLNKIHPVVLISPTSSVNRTKLPAGSYVVKSDNFVAWWQTQADGIGLGTALGMIGRHMSGGLSQEAFVALGKQLADAHVTAKYDWRARLRLPAAEAPAELVEPKPTISQAFSAGSAEANDSLTIATIHGQVTISRIPDGRHALRNEKNDALIELVKRSCKGKARWNPRYRNWLIEEAQLPDVLALLNQPANDQAPE
jgi:Nuclease-related domain